MFPGETGFEPAPWGFDNPHGLNSMNEETRNSVPLPQADQSSDCEAKPPSSLKDEERTNEDLQALKELARITPSNEALRALAAKSPPPPTWFDEEDEEELPS
jgi:hypothetical protein